MFPGLSFADRPSLFEGLLSVEEVADKSIDVILGDRPAVLVLDPEVVRSVLLSSARKGRPSESLAGIQGHIALSGSEFTRKRAAVMTALRRAAPSPSHFGPTYPCHPGGDPYGVDALLMANLAGASLGPHISDLCRRAHAAMRTALSEDGAHLGSRDDLEQVYAELQSVIVSTAPFVSELLDRRWSVSEIAAEIVTLTFAGWASLAAALRSARTLGVGGTPTTEATITELLRIAPPGWLITRETLEPLALSGRGALIPSGTLLVMSPWLLHHSGTAWDRPMCFDTSRHGTTSSAAFMPFSIGRRSCPAERYSRGFLQSLLLQQTPPQPSAAYRPALTDERSTCLIPQED